MNLHKLRKNSAPYVLIAPAVTLIILVMIYPSIYSFIITLTNLKLGKVNVDFIGLENYISLFTRDDIFYHSMYLTIYFVLATNFFEFIIGMLMALALNRKGKFCGIVKALLVIPWALPGTIVSGMWRFIYLRDYGFINVFLRSIGFSGNIQWLGYKLAMGSVMFAEVWRMTPFVALMLLAGLSSIPQEVYDAASIDGANAWDIFWRITLPMLKPILAIVFILRTIFAFQNMEMIYVLTKGGPGTATLLLPYYMYRMMFVYLRAGYGNSIAYIATLVVGIICLSYLFIFRDRDRIG